MKMMKRKDINASDLTIVKNTLRLMLDNKQHFDQGMCRWLLTTWAHTRLSSEDRIITYKYIQSNRPLLTGIRYYFTAFWWRAGDITPRIKWMEKHISLIEKELINRKRPI